MIRSLVIAILLVAFAGICGMFNASGIMPMEIAGDTYSGFDQAVITDLTNAAANAENNPLGGISGIGTMLSTYWNAVITSICIIPLMNSFNIPWYISWVIQGIIWIVYLSDLINWVRNSTPN
ncbi:MAG: hypothetical protein PHW36_00770 [Bacilli bacterium]|nr:hypothetical protein [Bacilli bacterium]